MPRPAEIHTYAELLSRFTREGELYEKLESNKLRCTACGHMCLILDGHDGVCRVRFNRGGTLYVPHGYVAGLHPDPIEKKPLFHAYPGCTALSFGMLGCSFHCDYCQNWMTSQALRDPGAFSTPDVMTAGEVVALAGKCGAKVLTSTYNEPLITSEWAVEIFKLAKEAGLVCSYVSNGNATRQVLEYLRPYVDLYKIDLKCFDDRHYRKKLGGMLQTVLDSIGAAWEMGFWVEVVTLVVPGFNDSDGELRRIAGFLRSVSPDIPWHVTAFHQNYKMTGPEDTPVATLLRAAEIGRGEGLHFVYAGNLPGMVSELENTYCPSCGELLVERLGFHVRQNRLLKGTCPKCRAAVAGRWE
ncbi:MAG: AmmeMemoRadiSam system radical SAM enzyme [Acidobacteriota bacterium]|nr:MAG: AmmeMemoRadiSam system radical SAM enzyme [Acidobacteriota bacterium]